VLPLSGSVESCASRQVGFAVIANNVGTYRQEADLKQVHTLHVP